MIKVERDEAESVLTDVERVVKLMLKHGFSTGHADTTTDALEEFDWQLKERLDGYYELLEAVGTRYQDETRIQTALRYIRDAEKATNNEVSGARNEP